MNKFILCIITLLCFSSCKNNLVYSEKYVIENQLWKYSHPLSFNFEITDTVQKFDLVLKVTHNREYLSQNVYCKFSTEYPDNHIIEDIVSLELSDAMGRWNGKCTSTSCSLDILLKPNIVFKELGMHHITIQQHSRKETLEGIESMELKLLKSQNNN